jgi:hypothetical protein
VFEKGHSEERTFGPNREEGTTAGEKSTMTSFFNKHQHDKVMGDETGRTWGEVRSAHKVLVRKPEGKTALQTSRLIHDPADHVSQ